MCPINQYKSIHSKAGYSIRLLPSVSEHQIYSGTRSNSLIAILGHSRWSLVLLQDYGSGFVNTNVCFTTGIRRQIPMVLCQFMICLVTE